MRTMLEFDGSELRAQVFQDFQLLASGMTSAEEMNRFTDAVMSTAVGTIRENLHAVNNANPATRLPVAVLVTCFAKLPFRYRISPTHVCRSWRAAALSEPSLWSYVSPWSPAACTPHMLETTLSRAGELPVELRVISRPGTAAEELYTAIAPFACRVRYLAWHAEPPKSRWECPAPRMEYFCSSSTVTLSEGSFGGQAGQLRCIYLQAVHFPATCLALSTVVDLSVALTPYGDDTPSTIRNVFDLFPRLESLQILGIIGTAAHMLPSGRAPPSLQELALHSEDDNYDLTQNLAQWDTGSVQHITLTQHLDAHPNLEVLAGGTVKLVVRRSDSDHTSLMFEHSATVSHSVCLPRSALADVAALLGALHPHLANVHYVTVSHVALGALAGLLDTLPKLEHVLVHIEPAPERPGTYAMLEPPPFNWRPLAFLPRRALRAVTVLVWCGTRFSSWCSPTANDARALLVALPRGLAPVVEIHGFGADVVAAVDAAGLPVRFDVAAKVGRLVLWERKRTRYPFHHGG